MKFSIGEKVRIRKSGKFGHIIQSKREITYYKDNSVKDYKRYLIKTENFFSEWFYENEVAHQYEFTPAYDKSFLGFIIDICLKENQHGLINNFHKQRNEIK